MADQYQYQHHAHYRSEHVELPMARSTSDFHSPTQPYKGSPYQSEQEHDQKDYESQYSLAKIPTLDSERGYTSPPQRPVYPTAHKDVSYTSDFSDARSIATSRYPGFNTQAQLPPDAGVQEKQPSFLSRVLPSSIACRLYLLVVLIETIVDIAIESDLLVLVNGANLGDSLETRRLPVYLVVFALAHLAQLVLALDAVHAQNTLQFMFLAAFNAAILAYAVVQKAEINAIINSDTDGLANIPVDALTIIIICVVSLSQVAYIGLAWKIYTEFGWKVYKLLGADRGIKRMYMHLQVFLCLCKFDVIFFIGFGVQWLYLVLEQKDFEYWVTIAALPFSVVVLAIGYRAAHNENKWLMGAFIAGSTAACVYFVYKSWKILAFRNDETYRPLFKSLMTFSALSTILLVVTFAWAMIVMHNFGHGLKARVAKHKTGASVAFSTRTGRAGNQFEMRTHPHRLSID